ncbi:MAG: hypothetical protein C4291_14495 [Candidatus Dadabacteria bacterium]
MSRSSIDGRTYRVLMVDIDKDYEKFMKLHKRFYLRYLRWIADRLGMCVEHVTFRRSANSHVHVEILLCRDPPSLEDYVMWLVACGCDIGMASHSWGRLRDLGDPWVKLFEKKKIYAGDLRRLLENRE